MKKDKVEDPNLESTNSDQTAPDTQAQTDGQPQTDKQPVSSQAEPNDPAPKHSQTSTNNQTTATPSTDSQAAELLIDLQRTRADFENYRKQVESQKALAMSAAKYATVEKFLPLIDDFERALSAYPEQLAPLRKNLEKTLSTLSLSRIDSDPGTEFNPDLHEAVSVEDDDGETEVIAETLRPGYLYDGSVIRAAMVKVKHQ